MILFPALEDQIFGSSTGRKTPWTMGLLLGANLGGVKNHSALQMQHPDVFTFHPYTYNACFKRCNLPSRGLVPNIAQQKGTISCCGNYRWDESFKVFFQEFFSMLSLRRGKIAEGWRQFPGFPKCCRFGIHNDTSIWRPSFSSFAEIPYMSSCLLQCNGATKKAC